MRVDLEEASSRYTLWPETPAESEAIETFRESVAVGSQLIKGGRVEDGNTFSLFFFTGAPLSTREAVECSDPKTGILRTNGTVRGMFVTSTKPSQLEELRNDIFYGQSRGATVVDYPVGAETGRGLALVAAYCRECNAPLHGVDACVWLICNECASRCAHEFRKGAGIAVKGPPPEFCNKCGTRRPARE